MTTRAQAYAQFLSWYDEARPDWRSQDDIARDVDNEFADWWKNASADSHELQGIQYQHTWAELAPQIRQRIFDRLAEGNFPGTEVPDSQLLPSFTNEQLEPLYQSGAIPLPPAVASQGGSTSSGAMSSGDMSIVYGLSGSTSPSGQPPLPNSGLSSGWYPQPTSGLFGPAPSVAAVGTGGLSLTTPGGGINWFLILAIAAGAWFLTRGKRS